MYEGYAAETGIQGELQLYRSANAMSVVSACVEDCKFEELRGAATLTKSLAGGAIVDTEQYPGAMFTQLRCAQHPTYEPSTVAVAV